MFYSLSSSTNVTSIKILLYLLTQIIVLKIQYWQFKEYIFQNWENTKYFFKLEPSSSCKLSINVIRLFKFIDIFENDLQRQDPEITKLND